MCLSGQDPIVYLLEDDPFKRNLMLKVAQRHTELLLDYNDDLATKIIKRLAEAWK